MGREDNQADYNVYVSTREPGLVDLNSWQKSGFGEHSKTMRSIAQFNPIAMYFYWKAHESLPRVLSLPEVTTDFYADKREGTTIPGPFVKIPRELKLLFNENTLHE